uniref:FHA domain-containing protein n=1 Tax=Meloidogyne hapla TaxID=6305 RepID=A0A1I8BM42_MELHA
MIERNLEKEKMIENKQDNQPTTSTTLVEQIWQKRKKDIGKEIIINQQQHNNKSFPIRPNNLFIPNYSPLPPTRPKSELAKRPSISLNDSTVFQDVGCDSNHGRFTIKYDNTEYIVDVGGSHTNINESKEGINNNLNNKNINYRLYRRSNSVAGNNKFNINNKPKMSVVGRMASIFVNDVINSKQTLIEQENKQQNRPTSWRLLGKKNNNQSQRLEISSVTDNSIATIEGDNYNDNFNSNNKKTNEEEEKQQKHLGEMAAEAVKK